MNIRFGHPWLLLIVLMLNFGCSNSKKIAQKEVKEDEPKLTIIGPDLVIELPLNKKKNIKLPSFVELNRVMDSAMRVGPKR